VRPVRLDLDRSLVVAARDDPARFDALYRKYVAQVYSFATYELRDRHDAEDVTARTFLSALAGLPGFTERTADPDEPEASSFRVWLFTIARHAIAEHRRSRRRHPATDLGAAVELADPTDPSRTVERHEDAGSAWRAVADLPGDRRRALVLRFVHEMTTAEIAAVLGRSEGAVRVLIHRALRSVAADLDRRR